MKNINDFELTEKVTVGQARKWMADKDDNSKDGKQGKDSKYNKSDQGNQGKDDQTGDNGGWRRRLSCAAHAPTLKFRSRIVR